MKKRKSKEMRNFLRQEIVKTLRELKLFFLFAAVDADSAPPSITFYLYPTDGKHHVRYINVMTFSIASTPVPFAIFIHKNNKSDIMTAFNYMGRNKTRLCVADNPQPVKRHYICLQAANFMMMSLFRKN